MRACANDKYVKGVDLDLELQKSILNQMTIYDRSVQAASKKKIKTETISQNRPKGIKLDNDVTTAMDAYNYCFDALPKFQICCTYALMVAFPTKQEAKALKTDADSLSLVRQKVFHCLNQVVAQFSGNMLKGLRKFRKTVRGDKVIDLGNHEADFGGALNVFSIGASKFAKNSNAYKESVIMQTKSKDVKTAFKPYVASVISGNVQATVSTLNNVTSKLVILCRYCDDCLLSQDENSQETEFLKVEENYLKDFSKLVTSFSGAANDLKKGRVQGQLTELSTLIQDSFEQEKGLLESNPRRQHLQ